jgi:hypothetical protein
MNYQTVEQLWCKVQASNDALSQGACWLNFEAQYPPGSKQFDQLVGGFALVAIVLILAIAKVRSGGLFGWRKI